MLFEIAIVEIKDNRIHKVAEAFPAVCGDTCKGKIHTHLGNIVPITDVTKPSNDQLSVYARGARAGRRKRESKEYEILITNGQPSVVETTFLVGFGDSALRIDRQSKCRPELKSLVDEIKQFVANNI